MDVCSGKWGPKRSNETSSILHKSEVYLIERVIYKQEKRPVQSEIKDCLNMYTIYIPLCTQSADQNAFRCNVDHFP